MFKWLHAPAVDVATGSFNVSVGECASINVSINADATFPITVTVAVAVTVAVRVNYRSTPRRCQSRNQASHVHTSRRYPATKMPHSSRIGHSVLLLDE